MATSCTELSAIRAPLERYLRARYGDAAALKSFEELGEGVHGIGYKIELGGVTAEFSKTLVLKTLYPEHFGHDYFPDRAQVLLLAHHAYNLLPRHVQSCDVLGFTGDAFVSVGDVREFYILMEEAKGENYFNDLKRILMRGAVEPADLRKAARLADYLVKIHAQKPEGEEYHLSSLYRRRWRDLVGHGECIMGVIDTYPPDIKFVSFEWLTELVSKCVHFWGSHRLKSERLCVVHGDFHPGNIWWHGKDFTVLDRSRGIYGEPADDVSCLSINYLFYNLLSGKLDAFEGAFRELYDAFMNRYFARTRDYEMLELIAPFYAFRALVIANPLFYPELSDKGRRKLLQFAEALLNAKTFEYQEVEKYL